MHHPHRSRAGTRAALSLTVAATLMLSGTFAASASTTNPDPTSLELADAQLSKEAATQGMVLLENHDNALPIAPTSNSAPTNVALFGVLFRPKERTRETAWPAECLGGPWIDGWTRERTRRQAGAGLVLIGHP